MRNRVNKYIAIISWVFLLSNLRGTSPARSSSSSSSKETRNQRSTTDQSPSSQNPHPRLRFARDSVRTSVQTSTTPAPSWRTLEGRDYIICAQQRRWTPAERSLCALKGIRKRTTSDVTVCLKSDFKSFSLKLSEVDPIFMPDNLKLILLRTQPVENSSFQRFVLRFILKIQSSVPF